MTTTTRVAVSAGLALALWLADAAIQAQTSSAAAETKALYETIAGLDAVLFDGFNTCDLDKFGNLLAEDVEFFHDKTGLMLTRKTVVASVKDNICGKVRRELVSGTLEVYPIPGFGAIEAGSHRFYENRWWKKHGCWHRTIPPHLESIQRPMEDHTHGQL